MKRIDFVVDEFCSIKGVILGCFLVFPSLGRVDMSSKSILDLG
jgi:hypothetical protein